MPTMTLTNALRGHWPEYLIEGAALGTFMISAAVMSVLFAHPTSPIASAIGDPRLGRAAIGIAMGLTNVCLIYSRWGKRSGAHMNPAVTLTFFRLGKVAGADALFYVVAQFVGGTLGVVVALALLGSAFADPPVTYAATMPGGSQWAALIAEAVISMLMMTTILIVSNRSALAPFTGLFGGALVALFIAFEAPISGMSMNPARSFASAVPAQMWQNFWIYVIGPLAGMLAASELYVRVFGRARVKCAKLLHPDDVRCIHCGYEPPHATPITAIHSA
jgi:aquaporin Z